jgi:hypothetical protein
MIPTEMWRVMINGGRIEIQESFESGIRARDARMRNARRNQICVRITTACATGNV